MAVCTAATAAPGGASEAFSPTTCMPRTCTAMGWMGPTALGESVGRVGSAAGAAEACAGARDFCTRFGFSGARAAVLPGRGRLLGALSRGALVGTGEVCAGATLPAAGCAASAASAGFAGTAPTVAGAGASAAACAISFGIGAAGGGRMSFGASPGAVAAPCGGGPPLNRCAPVVGGRRLPFSLSTVLVGALFRRSTCRRRRRRRLTILLRTSAF
jgi:hypothetical protein